MNKQSTTYTLLYITVLVTVVGAALAFTSLSLKDRQHENANADKMRQILASVAIHPAEAQDSILADFDRYITDAFVVDVAGQRVEDYDAFEVNVAEQARKSAARRLLPVYVCTLGDGDTKYILPLYGSGLWGPIWGYISVDSDGQTIYNAYFAHQGETPGLGAEIEKPAFSSQFAGKTLFQNGHFEPIRVVKAGRARPGDTHTIDGVSGGTITSKGVGAMIDNCLAPYQNFLKTL